MSQGLYRATAYRLRRCIETEGGAALRDGRHGHATTRRGPIREWLEEFCRGEPGAPSRGAQEALHELDDLFQMILRRNPRRVSVELFRQRLQEKAIQQKWPRVRVIDG